jgi:hypothetical protein
VSPPKNAKAPANTLNFYARKPAVEIRNIVEADQWSCKTCMDFGYRVFEEECRSINALAAHLNNIGGHVMPCRSCSS